MISIVVVNHLKPLLPLLISLEHIGFVKGQHILDGIIATREIIHSFKQSKYIGMMIKLDMYKSYDRISWDYLTQVLDAFGFAWKWIYSLISSPFFSILINDSPSTLFSSSCGLF